MASFINIKLNSCRKQIIFLQSTNMEKRRYTLQMQIFKFSSPIYSQLLEFPIRRHGHGPIKFIPQSLRENLVDGHFISFTPCNTDSRIHVVYFRSSERNFLVFVTIVDINLEFPDIFCPFLDSGLYRGL